MGKKDILSEEQNRGTKRAPSLASLKSVNSSFINLVLYTFNWRLKISTFFFPFVRKILAFIL